MIASLKGRITHIDSRYAILDVNGVGYKVFVTEGAINALTPGTEASFWTHLAVREDAMDIYGFTAKKDKDLFELLIGVSGIGPKSALNVMSMVSSEQLVSAIRTGSTAHLVKVSGIGKKTAEKIVLELKDRLGGLDLVSGASADRMAIGAAMSSDMDAIEALKALGYDADEAREALKKASSQVGDGKEPSTGQKIKAALKLLS